MLSLLLLALIGALAVDTLRTRTVRGERWELLALLGIVASGAVLRALQLGTSSLEHLEATYLFEAIKPDSVLGVITSRQSAEQMHQPLYPLILRGWAALSLSEAWLRLPSLVLTLGCVPLVWSMVRDELSAAAALWGAALTAASPLMVWYGRDASPYALLALCTVTALASGRQALAVDSVAKPGSEHGRRRWLAVRAAIAVSLAFYTHFHGGWVAITLGLWMLAERDGRGRRVSPAFWETTLATAAMCLPWLGALLDKLLTSVQGLTEDAPVMRYSHDPLEATTEALRVLLGGPTPAWGLSLLLVATGAVLLSRAHNRLGRLVLVTLTVGLVAEVHILWQLQRAKGITYVDVRHYIYVAPVLAVAGAALAWRWPRRGAGLAGALLALQLSTSIPMLAEHKPDVRAAVEHMRPYLGPDHAVAFLPAPWYQSILEVYLLGVCPDLVHGRSHEGWWRMDTCEQLEAPADNTVYGFPPTPERMAWSARRQSLRYLWVVDIRDHRFGLPVAPTDPQERFLCWQAREAARMARLEFGPWVRLELFDMQRLRTLGAPPKTTAHPGVRTVTASQAWELRCLDPAAATR